MLSYSKKVWVAKSAVAKFTRWLPYGKQWQGGWIINAQEDKTSRH